MITSSAVAHVMQLVDRANYCLPRTPHPYADIPNSIGYGATISAPHMHAYVLELSMKRLLKSDGPLRVLDVGSGSGYLSVCYARLLEHVR